MKKRYLGMALALAVALPMAAQAGEGYATINLGLYAGPDVGYPYLSTVPAGAPVTVIGCTPDWMWCDVFADGYRGWVAGEYLEQPYDGSWVSVGYYGPRIGIPIVRFDLDYYWGHHYRGRPFYRDRDHWVHRDFHHEPPHYRYAPRREYGHYEHDRPPVIMRHEYRSHGGPPHHDDRGGSGHAYIRTQSNDHHRYRGAQGDVSHRDNPYGNRGNPGHAYVRPQSNDHHGYRGEQGNVSHRGNPHGNRGNQGHNDHRDNKHGHDNHQDHKDHHEH